MDCVWLRELALRWVLLWLLLLLVVAPSGAPTTSGSVIQASECRHCSHPSIVLHDQTRPQIRKTNHSHASSMHAQWPAASTQGRARLARPPARPEIAPCNSSVASGAQGQPSRQQQQQQQSPQERTRPKRQDSSINSAPTKTNSSTGSADDASELDSFIEVSPDIETHLDAGRALRQRAGAKLGPGGQLDRPTQENVGAQHHTSSEALATPSSSQRGARLLAAQRSGGATYAAPRDTGAARRPAPVIARQHQPAPAAQAQLQRALPPGATSAAPTDPMSRLYLDTSTPLEVEAHVGTTAYLMCRLRALQQQHQHLRVSWVRNMQILTSGEFRYTSDERFRPTHVAQSADWTLEVHNVQASDEGAYECQVNSEPKPASVALYLRVITASVEIVEAPQLWVASDEPIRLTCRVEFSSQQQQRPATSTDSTSTGSTSSTQSPEVDGSELVQASTELASFSSQHYIYWYKDNVSLEYNNPRGGVHVERRQWASALESCLTVGVAREADSGAYVCKLLPELSDVAPARVHVLVGPTSGAAERVGVARAAASALASSLLLLAAL